ncbi:MAG: tetratricopeptide repeat protein [Terracidiphilus sp.]
MKRFFPFALVMVGCLAGSLAVALAQSPAPGDSQANGQSKPATEGQKPATAPQSSANPFPEDTSNVPVMPSKVTPPLPERAYYGGNNAAPPLPGDDLDPIRSPDDPASASDSDQGEASSSSLSGLERLLPKPEDDQPEKKKKLLFKEPTHEEAATEDINVGGYYLQTKNWKAALSRFESALVLDPENPEVYWGLAEAQHHLGDLATAKANYLKLLDYDPDGPHGKRARKELKDPAIANAHAAAPVPPAPGTP